MRILIFGNSGSGKTTLAKRLSKDNGLPHLDLDILAWQATEPPKRLPLLQSKAKIECFTNEQTNWIIEGCYSDLLTFVIPDATKLYFLNPGTDVCLENCKARPWEPHKFATKKAQDAMLDILLDWVRAYDTRADEFSLASHQDLFRSFAGQKHELKTRQDIGHVTLGESVHSPTKLPRSF